MKRKMSWLLFCLLLFMLLMAGCGNAEGADKNQPTLQSESTDTEAVSQTANYDKTETINVMQIRISTASHSIIFELNNSSAAQALYDQLPLTIPIENYSSNEKIFYPSEKLDISDAPAAQGPAGTIAYYAPWGNIAIFYGKCSGANGLYQLGQAIDGTEQIENLAGEIHIEKWIETEIASRP